MVKTLVVFWKKVRGNPAFCHGCKGNPSERAGKAQAAISRPRAKASGFPGSRLSRPLHPSRRHRQQHKSRSRLTLALSHPQPLSLQKKTLAASEQDRPDIKAAREEWTTTRQPHMRLEPHRLIFIDETGTTTKMTRLRGRCLKGQRLRSKAPFGHWMTQTFVAGLRCDRLTAPFVVNAAMDRRIFETYVEKELAPTLEKGDVVIMDNLPAHKSKAAEKAIKARGA
jgi:hypothetical protein